jgi:hypothetical protein
VDSTGTNALLSWNPPAGTVANYIILRGTYDLSTGNYSYSQVGQVNGNTTTFEDFGSIASGNDNNNMYEVEAAYADGGLSPGDLSSLSQPSTQPTCNISVAAQLVRNETGRWQLMFSSIPTNVQTIALSWYWWGYFYDYRLPEPATPEIDIPVSALTNGVYVIPDWQTTNMIGNKTYGLVAMVQPIGIDKTRGKAVRAGYLPYDAPCFVDGRQHLKQNLQFELRAATVSQPYSCLVEGDPYYGSTCIGADTNYVESGFFHWSLMYKGYGVIAVDYMEMDDLWPFTANYEFHSRLEDTNNVPGSFQWQTNLDTIPAPAVLDLVTSPYWIHDDIYPDPVADPADLGAIVSGGGTIVSLPSSVHNLFGLLVN